MNIFVIITLALLVGKILCMIYNKLPTDVLALIIINITLVSTTLSTDEALSCFSSRPVILIGVFSVLVCGMIHSGVVQWVAKNMLGNPDSYRRALVRLMVPASLLSVFIRNMAVVQLLISVVKVWGKRLNIAPSKLLLPLSYAATLGGLCTIIGNTPNLIVAEFYQAETKQHMEFFEPLVPGLFCAVVGMIVIMLFHRLIPVRQSPEDSFDSSADYTVELLVPTECSHIGETVEEAGLYSVNGGQIIEIVRFDREVISPVPKDEFILGGDRLVYSGQIHAILELRKTHNLVNATHHVFSVKEMDRNRKFQTASIDIDSPLQGMTISNTDFEDNNGVVLVAVAREGERLNVSPREVELRAGDTLLLEGTKLYPEHFVGNLNFFDNIPLPQSGWKTLASSLIMLGMVLLTATGVMPLINSCFLAALLMGLIRCFSVDQLQRSINWKVILVFAGSICLGKAIDASDIDQLVANNLLSITGTNPIFTLVLIAFSATVVTEFVSNSTASAVFAPIAMHAAHLHGIDPMPFMISLMIAASCSFSTPISSESNTLIYGPGGYKFHDYLALGICMNMCLFIANVFIITVYYGL